MPTGAILPASRRSLLVGLGGAGLLAACGREQKASTGGGDAVQSNRWAKTFTISQRDGFKVVDFRARMVEWGGAAQGQVQSRKVVLAPKGGPEPILTGDLANASVIRTPVERIAVNYAPQEAMVVELGVADRLVAVGGVKSFDDGIRERVRNGELLQVGYSWHSSPILETVVASRPDVFVMTQMDSDHSAHLDRVLQMGVPVMPFFMAAEPDYMGQVEYIRLMGLLTGKEAEAEAFITRVANRVDQLKKAAATRPKRSVLHAWWTGGDVWMVTTRNGDAQMLKDAGATVVLEQPDDERYDSTVRLGTERLLTDARDAEFWIARDPISNAYRDRRVLEQFKAFREGRVYAMDGLVKREVDSYGLWNIGPIRPDLMLADYVKMIHPDLVREPFTYLTLDHRTGAA